MNDGNTFEDTVSRLLTAAGHRMTREHIVGHKKIDLYFEERRLGMPRRIAVECKDHGHALSQSELNHIYANYLPLHRDNIIDEILVVTRSGLAPSAQTMVQITRELVHITLAELQRDIMDFESYLNGLIKQYQDDGLSNYYVPLLTDTGEDLEAVVEKWLLGTEPRPLAILGSYGSGKSTFACRFCSVLAERALHDMSSRLPILIKLGDISSEQSLEGLLGKALTAASVVRGYTFHTFMELNAAGRFVILLDGFDEMKHTLSWEDFLFNLKQLNRLAGAGSKIILLGRPTAFLNEDEQQHALHGIYHHRGVRFREVGWPDFRELRIALFSQTQVKAFLTSYLNFKRGTADSEKTKQQINSRISQMDAIFRKDHLTDIARRPVQLRMLAEILPNWKGDISRLTVAILYSVFVDTVIDREQEKLVRRRFNRKERRAFATAVAWWMWCSTQRTSIFARDIPRTIIEAFAGRDDKLEPVLRDLVSACFLERKIGDALYFPHRSFQEFLVAEAIIERLASGDLALAEAKELITSEVADFICGSVDIGFAKSCEPQLQVYRGRLPWKLVRAWMGNSSFSDYLLGKLRTTEIPWYPLFLAVGLSNDSLPFLQIRELKNELLDRMGQSSNVPFRVLCFLGVMLILPRLQDRWSRSVTGISALTRLCERSEIKLSKKEKKKRADRYSERPNTGVRQQPDDVIIKMMSSLNMSRDQQTGTVWIDLSEAYPLLLTFIRQYCCLTEWLEGGHPFPDEIDSGGFKGLSIIEEFRKTWC